MLSIAAKRFLVTLLSLAALTLPLRALACTCNVLDADSFIARFSDVVSGKAIAIHDPTGERLHQAPVGPHWISFKVGRTLKGELSGTIQVRLISRDSNICGAYIKLGEQLILGLGRSSDQRLVTGMCGVYPMNDDRNRPRMLRALDQYRMRLIQIDDAISRAPADLDRKRDKAFFFATQSEFNRALNVYNNILTRAPDDLASLTGIGDVYLQMRDYERAASSFDRAVNTHPHDEQTRVKLEQARFQLEKQRATSGARSNPN